ncbi:MAG: aminotransferase class V-fold PLP-dependent enzyme, partial [Planctomycetes bacterium]|nr:aminotransferase class V-fold PLP-dependent enzyme [Planctomycetota bacterium]
SPTGVVNPIERLVRELHARGVDTLVDGAHAPGMLPLALADLGVAYYTGNCHKWLCTPKGSALLYVRRDRQHLVRPLSISHGANSARTDRSRFRLEFDFTGTADYTPYLCVPGAIAFLEQLLPGGIAALQRHNRELALRGRALLCEALGCAAPAPDEMIGSLASVAIRSSDEPTVTPQALDPLQVALWERHRIEVPVMRWPKPRRRLLRISPQAYNTEEQYAYLAAAVQTLV